MTVNPRPWYKLGLRFACLPDCHKCCLRSGIVSLMYGDEGRPSEMEAIADYMKMPVKEFRKRYVKCDLANGEYMDEAEGRSGCPLWKDGCSVYPARPKQCRVYPFWPEVLRSARAWAREAEKCPGMNQGKLFTREEIDELKRSV